MRWRADSGDGQSIGSTTAKAHRSGAGGKASDLPFARRATKIDAIVDARGRPMAIEVTPGHLGDVRVATAFITGVPAAGAWPPTPSTTAMVCAAFFSDAAQFRSSQTNRHQKPTANFAAAVMLAAVIIQSI